MSDSNEDCESAKPMDSSSGVNEASEQANDAESSEATIAGPVWVRWSGREWQLPDLKASMRLSDLKKHIQQLTEVHPHRQKLLNLKHAGKPPSDDCLVSDLNLKPNFKIMMMGSLEKDIEDVSFKPPDSEDVVNDLDIPDEEVAIESADVYLNKIEKRIKEYKVTMLNEPRPDKKLLVLDIDYTLFDHKSAAETGYELMRPFLHEFLTSAYDHYDIVIWSATGMKYIEEKMKLLNVTSHQDYKILFYLDHSAMITVHTPKYGVINVKPLGLIWGKFKQYSSKNTIMFDDIRRNFIMNPKTGLKIRPFRQAHLNREKDRELLHLAVYLKNIATHCDDFNELNHKHWESYKPLKKHRKSSGNKRKADDNTNEPDGKID